MVKNIYDDQIHTLNRVYEDVQVDNTTNGDPTQLALTDLLNAH